jgi:glycine betaine/proline transport system ATP-binding protein
MSEAVIFSHVDIVFGPDAPKALALLDAGRTRDEILSQSNHVIGVADADLSVETGEIFVMMGLSGSGKSTLLRAVNGLNRIARGHVKVRHQGKMVDVAACGAATLRDVRARSVAMVFQQFALLPWRSVRDNVGFGLELRGMSRKDRDKIVDEKLEMVGLSRWADKQTQELSGGMQQRVGLARAFATDADILLMDEPFSALDPLIRSKLQDELLILQKKLQKTILFVSHDLDEAMKLGNRIAIMEGGRIVQIGTAEDIILHPANAYVAEFVAHMNPLQVLRGASLMRPANDLTRDGDSILLDAAGRLRLHLDAENRPLSAQIDGKAGRLATIDRETGRFDAATTDIVIAPLDVRLKAAIELRRASGHPIVLVDQLGRLAGLCGDEEIYRGLLRDL